MTWSHDAARTVVPAAAASTAPPIPPPVRKGGTATVAFTVITAVALVLGAIVIALVLLASGRPDALVVGLVLAALPVGPLVACYVWLDRNEPEPVRLLVLAFLWGALAATGGALVLQILDQLLVGADRAWTGVVAAPITEEAGKGIFVVLMLWLRRTYVDGLIDGLVYAGLVGVGFAFTENILYFAGAYTGGADFGPGGVGAATGLFVVRGIFSPFAHPLFTSMTGIGVGVAVITRSRALQVLAPLLGYVVAVCLHAAWNGSAFLGGGGAFVLTYVFAMVPGFLVAVGLAIWFRVREAARLRRSLEDLTRLGYLHPQELSWLVRLPDRRTARSEAARLGGPTAERLMRDYQRQAIALATLHARVLRGTPPPAYAERGAAMAQRLAALRAHLRSPELVAARAQQPPGWV